MLEQLKYADVKPVFKKDSRTDKKNYIPISILHTVSKIYERCINKQLEEYFQTLLSKYQCGFRKGCSVINALLPMIEKWRKSFDAGGAFGALLTDLSKAFDCLPNELLITKLHAYGVDIASLKLLHSYSIKWKQRVKLNGTYSSWSEILFGVPKGLILGLLLFNIFLYDLLQFFPDVDIANYADAPHIRSLCKKASQKLNAFARIAYSFKFEQRKILLNAFIASQFSYVLVVWMFHKRKLNNHINRIHERALRIAFQDHNSTFHKLLAKDDSFKIHDRNLQKLLIQIFKVKMNFALEIMNEVFDFIECRYSLRNELRFKSRKICTVRYGNETAAFVDSRIWTNIPNELKESTLLNEFKSKIKTWKPKNCSCKLCKTTFRELLTFKLLISIYSQMLLFMFLDYILFYFYFYFTY